MGGTLDGIRVIDMSRVLAGPWAGQLLADYGADVIKIEKPGSGDDTRRWGPPWLEKAERDDSRVAAYFLAANRNKRSITCNLAHPDGGRIVRDLAAVSDVVIENYRVGTMARFGLGAEALRERNPALVYCSISAYGQEGARAKEPGYDAMIQASAGLMSLTGEPAEQGGRPQKVGVAAADIMAGMYAATAILAALTRRQATGRGQTIDVPLFDSQVAWLANQALNYLIGGTVPKRYGTAHPNIVPYQAFATADGHLMLAVGTDAQFAACVECLGIGELAADRRFADNAARVEHRDLLVDLLAARFVTRSSAEWLKRLKSRQVPVGPINDLAAVFAEPSVSERGLVRQLEHSRAGAIPTVANPVRFSETPVEYRYAPPTVGEHTRQVLEDVLGYSAEKIAALADAGAI